MNKVIFFDFDGVILDSMPIRDDGFRSIFKHYPSCLVEEFIIYHQYNAGLSRFHKIRYFYETILNKDISEKLVNKYANTFSTLMKNKLTNKKYLIEDTLEFIKSNACLDMHIVSGSEEKELNYLCEYLNISSFFKTIEGSPTDKNTLVKNIFLKEKYKKEDCILIGDSINDYDAANVNGIKFYGFNNENLRLKDGYIDSFKNFLN